jgi:hypothetical protein
MRWEHFVNGCFSVLSGLPIAAMAKVNLLRRENFCHHADTNFAVIRPSGLTSRLRCFDRSVARIVSLGHLFCMIRRSWPDRFFQTRVGCNGAHGRHLIQTSI